MHHTKFKADIGLTKVIADLTQKGHTPCVPLSEHKPFDLLVALRTGRNIRVQVKYARLQPNGVVDVKTRTSWSDKHGVHERKYRSSDFDYFAIYCPERDVVLYVQNATNMPRQIRFTPTSNNQSKSIKWANSYFDIKGESSETIRHTPETVKT